MGYGAMEGYGFSLELGTALGTLPLLAAVALLMWRRLKAQAPHLSYSHLSDMHGITPPWRWRWRRLSMWLVLASAAWMWLAMANPRWLLPPRQVARTSETQNPIVRPTPTEGAALYFLLDVSGSMTREVAVYDDEDMPHFVSKMDLMKETTQRFIGGDPALGLPGRSQDMIGMVAFARAADIVAPLTLDHDAVLTRLKLLQPVASQARDGTGIGYAIYKTVNTLVATQHFAQKLPPGQRSAYTIQNTALILVTDGFQSTSPLDKGDWLRTMPMEDAASYAAEHGVVLYMINIEPRLAREEFEPHRKVMENVAKSTGGQFYLAQDPRTLGAIFREIDGLERQRTLVSTVQLGDDLPKESFLNLVPLCVLLSVLCLGGALCWDTIIARVVP